ncbi:MAG: flagellar basal body-associated FliL family protein [Rubrivivax sp.]|nr:flagellar basal body-associated FliL family protein [Rubrivivax sp.]
MATAAPTATDAPPAKGKKKLIIIIAAAVLVLAVGGGAAMVLLKKKPAEAEGEDGEPVAAEVKHDPKAAPVFVPLDPFTVNLADREAERYAQVGITLEITDAKTGDQIKAFMPAIRNNILMTIADRTAVEMAGREGKLQLAEKIRREASRAMGIEIEEEEAVDEEEEAPKKKKKGKKKAAQVLPIKAVHFSNFIIQ